MENSIVKVSDTDFTGNSAGLNGGAISNADQVILSVSDVRFAGNVAGGKGDAISTATQAPASVKASQFNGNAASVGANDVFSDDTSTVAITF